MPRKLHTSLKSLKRKSKTYANINYVSDFLNHRDYKLSESHPLAQWAFEQDGFDMEWFDMVTGLDLLSGHDDKPTKSEYAIFLGIQEKMRRRQRLCLIPKDEFPFVDERSSDEEEPEDEKKPETETATSDKKPGSDKKQDLRRSKRNLDQTPRYNY